MDKLSPQLTLGLSLTNEAVFENFFPGANAEIIVELKRLSKGEGERVIFLYGSHGLGGSHLLQACCQAAHQAKRRSVYLPLTQLTSLTPAILQGLETLDVICLDDLHAIAGQMEWEEALFHLYNQIYDAGGMLVIAAQDAPKAIHLKLPDLISRLSWGIVYRLRPLTDEEKLAALILRAHYQGIGLSEEVAKYILTHCPRHMSTLCAALDALDKASLAAHRRLTIPFVKEVLQI